MDYEKMWKELKAKIEKDLHFYDDGRMCSMMEAAQGSVHCSAMLSEMNAIEKKYKEDSASTKEEIRNAILSINKPFNYITLFHYMKDSHVIENKDLVFEVLEELCESGVLRCISNEVYSVYFKEECYKQRFGKS